MQSDESQQPTTQNHGLFINEALSKTKFGLFNYIVILLSGLIQFAVGLETCGCAFVIPVSKCDLNFTAGEKGLLSAISFVGIICSSHLWGFLADTRGRRKVMLPTMLMAFVLSCASSLCPNVRLLIVFRFLNGFFISGPASANVAFISECHSNKQRGRAIMLSSIISGISFLFLPILAGLVINQNWQFDIPFIGITYKPWRLFFIVGSLPGLIAFVMLIFLPESPKFVLGQGDKSGAYEILRKIYRLNVSGKSATTEFEVFDLIEEPESIENRQRQLECSQNSRLPFLASLWTQTLPLFTRPYLFATILLCGIQFSIYWTSNGFFMFFAEILNRMAINLKKIPHPRMPMCEVINMKSIEMTTMQPNHTVARNEMCTTKLEFEMLEQGLTLEITNALGLIAICLLIYRVGKFPILSISGAAGFACTLIKIPLLQIYSFIAHMFCSTAMNVTNAVTVDIYPTASRAMAIFISLMFGRLGCILGAITTAILLDNHCEMVFYLSGTILIVMAISSFFIPNIHKKDTV